MGEFAGGVFVLVALAQITCCFSYNQRMFGNIVVVIHVCYRTAFAEEWCEQLDSSRRILFERLRQEISNTRVIEAMERVPRDKFVPDMFRHLAYEDVPLVIGEGQTISQPYIVGIMLSALDLRRSDRVLEIGTGSGYQSALLAELARHVISIERIDILALSARNRLRNLGYTNVEVLKAEDRLGYEDEAPFDAIIVAAGAPKLPCELMEQMASGGRFVIPVGSRDDQELMKVIKSVDAYSVETLGACRFVPLIGEGAWPEHYDEAQEIK